MNNHELAQLGAEWWADKVIHPKFDNGDPSTVGGMATMFALLNVKPVDAEARKLFVSYLTEAIEKELTKGTRWLCVGVDYGPCPMLADAAERAKIPVGNFPWKTDMEFQQGRISVRYGYRAELEYLGEIP